MGLYTITVSSWHFPCCSREWFSLGLLQMSCNSCFLWEKPRSRRVLCSQPPSAAVPGFEASALGTAGGRGVWSEEGTRQGIEGLLLLLWARMFVAEQRVFLCFRQLFQHRVCCLELPEALQPLMMCIWSGAEANGSPHPSQTRGYARDVNHGITESTWNENQRSWWCLAAVLACGNVHRAAGENGVEVPLLQTAPHCSGWAQVWSSCHCSAPSCQTLPVVTGIMGMSFPSATVLQAQPEALPPSPDSGLTLMLG